MTKKNRRLGVALVLAMAPLSLGADKPPRQWAGFLLKPVARQAVFAFTKKPTVRKLGRDRYEISFAAKAYCDVAVCVEDEAGRIVRHIAYGVLGPNAPEPFQKNSLAQALVWDGKDDFGRYTERRERLRIRVSLGLRPTFDKVMAWHPKDTSQLRRIAAIGIDADGVYVLETSSWNQLRKYDHDARYVETLIPWKPEKLPRVRIPKRTIPDGKVWTKEPPPGRPYGPQMMGFGASEPFGGVQEYGAMAVAAGKIVATTCGYGPRRLLRIRTDGTTGGEPIQGALVHPNFRVKSTTPRLALSPDGKWIYFTGLDPQGRQIHRRGKIYWNAVFRVAWDRTDSRPVLSPDPRVGSRPFAGLIGGGSEGSTLGKRNDQFYQPEGLACDAKGRLYVCDNKNNRVQVFSPEGRYLKTIPVPAPQEIAVHQKTGEIYLLSYPPQPHNWTDKFGYEISHGGYTLLKLGPLEDPKVRIRHEVRVPGTRSQRAWFRPLMALDSWTPRPRVWVTAGPGKVQVLEERDGRFVLFDDFEQDVRKAGHTPHMMNGYNMPYTFVDPVRGHVYLGGAHDRPLRRMDPRDGKKWEVIRVELPGRSIDEATFGRDGLLYVRNLKYVARFDPDKMGRVLGPHAEVPFDYGQAIGRGGRRLRGVIDIHWAHGGANGFNNGLAVSPKGDVLCAVDNYQSFDEFKGDPKRYWDANQARRLIQMIRRGFRPRKYPGRPLSGSLIWRWDRRGEMTGEDLVQGMLDNSYGVRSDARGNIYVGVGYHQMVNGRAHVGGAVVKFPPTGGKFYAVFGRPVKLRPPGRPPEFSNYGARDGVWVDNAYWAVPGLDMVFFCDPVSRNYPCRCANCRFDTDVYGRSFIPRSCLYQVVVVDTNGNRICEIGRYGNADSPAMKPGDTDIGIAECSYLAVDSDRWLYLNDSGNLRILRIRLGYHAEKRLRIPER